MITFRQIRRQELFPFFVSMYRVAIFVHLKNIENLLFLACPFFGKTFFPKTRMSKKGTCACRFGPFWAILGHFGPFYVPFLAKAFSGKQETPIFGHASAPFYPKNTVLWHPPKRAKVIFWKQETPILGHASAPLRAIAPPKNAKSFFPKKWNSVFGTVLNDNPMITLR